MQGDSFDDDDELPPPNDQNDAGEDDEAQDGSATCQTMLDYLVSQGVLYLSHSHCLHYAMGRI